MRIREIRIEGFRGVRSRLTIPCGDGFTVISGRNGTGKSTLCDAIEFALTGTLARFMAHTEKRERIADYLWWRGEGEPNERFVAIKFEDDQGYEFEVYRGVSSFMDDSAVRRLYDATLAPPDPLNNLCQTTIIRDETITAFSTDLSESDRFDFVRRAIGLSETGKAEQRASELLPLVREEKRRAQLAYERARDVVAEVTARLSEARVTAASAGPIDIVAVRRAVGATIGVAAEESIIGLLSQVRTAIADSRRRIETLERFRMAQADFERRSARVRSAEFAKELREAEEFVKAAERQMADANAAYQAAEDRLSVYRQTSPLISRVAELRALGTEIGRREESCPLCGLSISEKDFRLHLEELEAEIRKSNEDLTTRAAEELQAKRVVETAMQALQDARNKRESLLRAQAEVGSELQNLQMQAVALKISLENDQLRRVINELSTKIADLEKQLNLLQANAALERIAAIERELQSAQATADRSDRSLQATSRTENMADQAGSIAKRVAGEVIDERLAQLSPLLLELYHRLRPHTEWTDVKYAMRGDVRRFLSLEVGDEINPRFIFSSGQRRSLGIAFLLAVHLSCRWCGLRTVVLDDPVQHIDDYRALHFAETLGAIRKTGRQVICAVEDPALADLLCRRLRSNVAEPGTRIEMDYVPGQGVVMSRSELVPVFESEVLLTA